MKKRYIKLNEEDIAYLQKEKKKSLKERIRTRAHALLLSNKGYEVKELSKIFDVRQATILDWFTKWEKNRKLSDSKKSGRPRNFSKSAEKK